MRYAYFRERGMFIGSGTVEAGCKAVVGQRLKLSGMRWNIPGANGILTLRCEQASNRFEHIWTRPTPGAAGRGSTAVPGIMRFMPHHRRMAFGYGTLVPTRGLGAVIASRNGFGPGGRPPCRNQVGGRRRRQAAVRHGGIVVTTYARADYVGELRLPGVADPV